MSFSTKLIKLRKSMGLSQEDLANEINVTRQTISKWELGTTIPNMDKLKLISNYFGVSVDELIAETKFNEKGYVNNNEFVGVDKKYIPVNENNINQSCVNKNKKSNIIFLIFLVPICIFIITFVITIIMFINNRKMIDKEFDINNTETDSKIQEIENYKDTKIQEFEEKQEEFYENMNAQKEKMDYNKQEIENKKNSVLE